jgi:hypothetical protein
MTINPMLPIIEDLASAQEDAERARWLLSAPISVLVTYQSTIRNQLQNAFFSEGLAWLDAELAAAQAVRRDGLAVKDNPLRGPMLAIAERRVFEGDAG